MKWWYVVLVIMVVGIVWSVVGKLLVKKTATVTTSNSIDEMTNDVNGKAVAAVQIVGTVQKWDPDSGTIEFVKNNVQLTALIDPAVTVIFAPARRPKAQGRGARGKHPPPGLVFTDRVCS